jgi:hypothetical protein
LEYPLDLVFHEHLALVVHQRVVHLLLLRHLLLLKKNAPREENDVAKQELDAAKQGEQEQELLPNPFPELPS